MLDSVLLQGFEPQSVTGLPANVPVTNRGFNEACAYTYGWEDFHNQGGGDYKLMVSRVRAFVGMNESSFQGCAAARPASGSVRYLERSKRSLSACLSTPVVMLTGQQDAQVAMRLALPGAADYILKVELTPERLVESLRQALPSRPLQ